MPARVYEDYSIAGWRVTSEAGDWHCKDDTLRILGDRLLEIEATLPGPPLALLKHVRFFVDRTPWFSSPFCYHPSGCGPFLLSRGEPAEKLRTINVVNPERFVPLASDPKHFPGAVLHELAHAYHDQFLPGGYGNTDVTSGYLWTVANGLYENVLNVTGVRHRGNATVNHVEYFASSTVSYFLRNDDEPFDRAQLEKYDPETHALIARLWGA